MRILMTGGTNRQIKRPEARGNSGSTMIDVPAYIVSALEHAGHTVDWRHVTPGEDLESRYDAVWFCWAPWLSRTTPGTFSALWAWKANLPRVVFLDDWAFHQGFSHMRTIMNPEAKGERFYLCRPDFFGGPSKWSQEQLEDFYPYVAGVGHDMLKPAEWQRSVVVTPQYGWGNRDAIREDDNWAGYIGEVFKLDPSGCVVEAELRQADVIPDVGEERWALGSLSPQADWVKKQMLRWPVAYYGCRSLNRKGVESPRLRTEVEVFDEYSRSEGVLAPPYNRLKGAAWFRSRWLYGALGGSYVLSDPADQLPGIEFRTGGEFEAAPQHIRDAWKAEQREFVLANSWTIEKFDAQVNALVTYVSTL